MSSAGVVTRLAVRELWISFRLLALLAAFVGVGAFVALLPAPPSVTFTRLAVGLGAAMVAACCISADAISTERVLGRVGWLVTRSVSRSTFLLSWFAALSSVTLLGLGAAGTLAWLATASPIGAQAPAGFAAVLGGVAAMALAFVAVGLLLGTMLRSWLAVVAALISGMAAITAMLLAAPAAVVPLAALADLAALERPIGDGLRGAGIFLAATAASLVAASVAMGRVDL